MNLPFGPDKEQMTCSCKESKSPLKPFPDALYGIWFYDCHLCKSPIYTTGVMFEGCKQHICPSCFKENT